jgi:hypothetical protein
MTPRIKELILKSGVVEYESDSKMRDAERLAILVIEECANVADENYIHRGSRTCGLAIRLHFGVEE